MVHDPDAGTESSIPPSQSGEESASNLGPSNLSAPLISDPSRGQAEFYVMNCKTFSDLEVLEGKNSISPFALMFREHYEREEDWLQPVLDHYQLDE